MSLYFKKNIEILFIWIHCTVPFKNYYAAVKEIDYISMYPIFCGTD